MRIIKFLIGAFLLLFCATSCREQSSQIIIEGRCIPIKAFEINDTNNATHKIIRCAQEVIEQTDSLLPRKPADEFCGRRIAFNSPTTQQTEN